MGYYRSNTSEKYHILQKFVICKLASELVTSTMDVV